MLEEIVGGLVESIGWGVGGVVIVGALLIGGPRAKPLAKGAIKGYLTATRRVREAAAEASESLQDIYAEAKHEYESQLRDEHVPAAEAEATGPVNIPIEHGADTA